jgi:hypothetical protein
MMTERRPAGGVPTWLARVLGCAAILCACSSSRTALVGPPDAATDSAPGLPEVRLPTDGGIEATTDVVAQADVATSDGGRVPYRAIAVATGELHTCALLDDHNIKCWGYNDSGQLGLGDKRAQIGLVPSEMGDALPVVDLGTGRTATAVVAARYATGAILDDGSVKCWGLSALTGQASSGDIGDEPGEMGDHLAPLEFGGRKALHLAIGDAAGCASMTDDTIWCWGGFSTSITPQTPQMLGGGPSTKKVAALSASACGGLLALYEDGTVGALGRPCQDTELLGGHNASAIGGSNGAQFAVLDNHTTVCSGVAGGPSRDMSAPSDTVAVGVQFTGDVATLSSSGIVQEGSTDDDGADVVALGQPAVALTNGGQGFWCALLADGGIKCWGYGGTMSVPWVGAVISLTQPAGGPVGPWSSVDLGAHP